MTNRKSYMRFRLVPKSMTLTQEGAKFFAEFCSSSHIWEATTAKRMKIDPYYQWQKCNPMTLVSGNIRRMRTFAGVPLGGGVKWQWGCRRRQFLAIWVATGYFFGNVRDNTSNITWLFDTHCRPVTDCKINDLEWPWVAISRQNPFSTSKLAVARLPLR